MGKNQENKARQFEHVKGTCDFYPPQSVFFRRIADTAERFFRLYGYEEIILPLLEERGVFIRSVGETSDIVERQMFKVEDKDIVLRPEGTAQVVRFFKEKSLHKQGGLHKFFYVGPMFRGEKPQKGRLRQFHHLGCEVFGSHSPFSDAEVIMLAADILNGCGVKNVVLHINSLGCENDKQRLVEYLKCSLEKKKDSLCELCRKRLDKNPLRVIDCKNRACREAVSSLTLGKDTLCDDCRGHFEQVLSLLDEYAVPYVYDPFLVRGLDYYTHTVFEFIASGLGAKDACGAGGRYNGLLKDMGGPDVPALGFALGLERVMLIMDSPAPAAPVVDVFVACVSQAVVDEGFKVTHELHRKGISADMDYSGKSLKSQLRTAERLGAPVVVMVGEDEVKEGCLTVRNMRESTQEKVDRTRFIPALREILETLHRKDVPE